MRTLLQWLNDRTNYQQLLLPIRHRMLPNGPSWTLSTASCVFWLLIIEIVTGFLLMASYSPSTNNAWASVNFIEQAAGGSFIRGLHYFAAQALIILLIGHVLRVILSGAFRAPRELIWISGLLLLPIVVVWTVTGNPLSGSVEGFAQINVEGNIAGSTPVIGPAIRQALIGGDQVGNLTLTHLYFLHVGLMPAIVLVLLLVHVTQMYKHGLSTGDYAHHPERARHYFPHQSVRNAIVFTILMAILSYLAWKQGAPHGAPADAGLPNDPRPEWYFLWLFELRRYFTGPYEFVATMIIPSGLLMTLLALPLIDHFYKRRTSRDLRLVVVILCVIFVGGLTAMAMIRDARDVDYQTAKRETESFGERAHELAKTHPIPPEGAVVLLRNDPKTQGPLLFKRHCIACHSAADASGKGLVATEPSAPNLYGFGKREWVEGWMNAEKIAGPHYFGKTKFAKGEMVKKVQELFEKAGAEKQDDLKGKLKQIATALSAEAQLPVQTEIDKADEATIATGRKLMKGSIGCTECHKFRDEGELGSAPDLTGYGSREWLTAFIGNPQHERFYPPEDNGKPKNDRMPAFTPFPEHPRQNLLDPTELQLLVQWLRGEWEESGPRDHEK